MALEHGEHVPDALAERYDGLHAQPRSARTASRARRAWTRVLEGLGFDAAARARPLASFSGGWLMRVELAKLLLPDPDVLLLDEPTNHLDLPSLEWFDETLAAFRGGVVLVSHDRAFLRRHAPRVAELAGGAARRSTRAAGTSTSSERERRREQAEAPSAARRTARSPRPSASSSASATRRARRARCRAA